MGKPAKTRKTTNCAKCGEQHTKKQKCAVTLSSTVMEGSSTSKQEVSGANISGIASRDDHMIALLTDITDRQTHFEERLIQLELNSSAEKQHPISHTVRSSQQHSLQRFDTEGVVPTLDVLRQSDTIQRQVGERLRNLEQATTYTGMSSSNTRNLKSGRFR